MYKVKSEFTNKPTLESFTPAGFQVNRRDFMVFASAAAASLMLPSFASASGNTQVYRMSLAGDLRKAFRTYIEHDLGNTASHALYDGKVTIDNITYHIRIDTGLCEASGACEKLLADVDALYFDDLIAVARGVSGDSVVVREFGV